MILKVAYQLNFDLNLFAIPQMLEWLESIFIRKFDTSFILFI